MVGISPFRSKRRERLAVSWDAIATNCDRLLAIYDVMTNSPRDAEHATRIEDRRRELQEARDNARARARAFRGLG